MWAVLLASLVVPWFASPCLAAGEKGGYVGMDACATCHEDVVKEWSKLPHSKLLLDKKLPPEKYGCEACHGPGEKHAGSTNAADILNPKKLKPKERDNACLSCHETKLNKIGWQQTPHYQSGQACYDCHDSHKAKGPAMMDKSEKELCGQCHAEVQAKFAMNSHHPLNEGRIKCASCHDVHNGRNEAMTRKDGNGLCLECHADKTGPYVYEHEAISQAFSDGCKECHMPHGSPNLKLLALAGRGLCYRCHGSAFVDHNPGLTCYDCHRAIHGSMTDEFFRE